MKLKVRKQRYASTCDHANPRQCHAALNGKQLVHWYFMWHLEGTDGNPTDDGPWYSAREARAFRDSLET